MNDVKLTDLTPKPQRPVVPAAEGVNSAASSSGKPVAGSSGPTPASGTGSPAPQAAEQPVSAKAQEAELQEAVTRLNDYVQSVQRDLQFDLDDSSGKTIITVVDRNTQEVVRQIPDDVALKLARNLQNEEPVSLFNAKA